MSRQRAGFFAIGIEHGKTVENLGTLWRSASLFGAAFIFTVGRRYENQSSDTCNTTNRIPLFHYRDVNDVIEHLPMGCPLVGLELDPNSLPVETYRHRPRACYILGAEDHGLRVETIARCHELVQLPGAHSMNVAAAGTVLMYDRHFKGDAWRGT